MTDTTNTAKTEPCPTFKRTIGKTTYIANLHFKERGQTFSEKLKRVLKADINMKS